ncbi:hypothetical protein [Sphingomonas immobilis]|uniref:Uncharacterized protein n=1 Tax=Sphingomonas immobilis TaxID=3063997 RepID=A0ABT8ZU12_9SPHN|nr:hypothetical protein [Sphingomonas sp. CA1-15]MDO7841061.1 hypothetical protein [Sphingomonas sp. CA1-15]
MRLRTPLILTTLAVVLGASSCGNRVETHLAFPAAADLTVDPEPAYPEAALQPGQAGADAERAWWTEVLIWGRMHHDRVARICAWARELKNPTAPGQCGAK